MIRHILPAFFICMYSTLWASVYTVFEANGKYGLRNEKGTIVVPAQYEKLGWSDGHKVVIKDVIGFQTKGLWGLLSVKNKVILPSQYQSMKPLAQRLIIVSTKGTFSNQLFYGAIDHKGNTLIGFNYSLLQPYNNHLLAGTYQHGRESVGIVSYKEQVLVPLHYRKIETYSYFIKAHTFSGKVDVFLNNQPVATAIDHIYLSNELYIIEQNGKLGALDEEGNQLVPMQFKSITKDKAGLRTEAFPVWTIYREGEKQFEWMCDSLTQLGEGVWMTFSNHSHRLVYPALENLDYHDFAIKQVHHDLIAVDNLERSEWSVLNRKGMTIVEGYDSISFGARNIYAKHPDGWNIYSMAGSKVNRNPYQMVIEGHGTQSMVKKNGYWGIVDFAGGKVANFNYDSIALSGNLYLARYIDRWGALDQHGNWFIRPVYDKVESRGSLSFGQQAHVYHFFVGQKVLANSTLRPLRWMRDNLLVASEYGSHGVMDQKGEHLLPLNYDSITSDGTFLKGRRSSYWEMYDQSGKIIIRYQDGVEQIGEVTEKRAAVRINGKWGFVDMDGKLRIANRYDSLMPYAEQLAGFKLRGRWGFLNHGEELVVQPHYDAVGVFENGLAIVSEKGRYGLIDTQGTEVVPMAYQRIKKTNRGNYLIVSDKGKMGLLNHEGRFVLRPSFDDVTDRGYLIVRQGKKYGVLAQDGTELFPIASDGVRTFDTYIGLMSAPSK